MKSVDADFFDRLSAYAGVHRPVSRIYSDGFTLVRPLPVFGSECASFRLTGFCGRNGSYPAVDPSRYAPGLYAVSDRGELFVLHGGDWERGAWAWTPVQVEGVRA